MKDNFPQIQELLHQRADYQARLNLLPYDGSPEIKESGGKRYLYIRKRIGSRLNSTYVDVCEMIGNPIHSRVRVRVSLDTDFSLFYISFQNEFFNQNY